MVRCVAAMLFALGAAAENLTLSPENENVTLSPESENASLSPENVTLSARNERALDLGEEAVAEEVELSPRNTSLAAFDVETYSAGGSLRVTWEDCGTKSWYPMAATITGFSPDRMPLGRKTTLTGWGDLHSAVQGGTVEMHTKAGFLTRTRQANLCEPMTDDMPMNAGKLTWRGLNCPVAAGPVGIISDIELARSLPRMLLRATVTITGTSSEGLPLFCMKIKTSPSRRLSSSDAEAVAEEEPGFLV